MKKILILLLIIVIKLNAYQYLYVESIRDSNSATYSRYNWYTDSSGKLQVKQESMNGSILYKAPSYEALYNSKVNRRTSTHQYYNITKYLKEDLQFLNDFYIQYPNYILNYFYNNNYFDNYNYIKYENYEILYNDDGLAVESIVDGVWAGLYDDSQKSKSGALYNKNGSMVYYNGKEVTPAVSFFVWLQKFTNKVVIETFEEIQRSLISGIIAAVVLVLAIVRLVLELLPSSITPRRRRYYGGGRGSLPDYGDGSQVAASVRARLAAKNRALKARAYDRSGVEQSTINGIIFDLENDR